MVVDKRGSGDLEFDGTASPSLEKASAQWPLGRMVMLVFMVCLAVWVTVIAYILRL